MHPEAAFLGGYALVLVAVAAGLVSLGRRSTHPWSSRVLAASRPPDSQPHDDDVAWPHSEAPAFHLGVSAVVLAAALLLTVVSLARHHRPVELVVQACLLGVIAWRIGGVVTATGAWRPLRTGRSRS